MREKASMTRRKFVSLLAAAALALSMVVAPAAAFAADATSGTLTPSATAITVLTGDSTNLGQYFKIDNLSPTGSDAHLDFVMGPSTAAATVNKHSGAYVATTEGVSTVTVYLMAGAAPQHNSGKPDTGVAILDQKTLTVNATSQNADYGFQGAGSNAIMVMSPKVTGTTQTSTSYENELSAPVLDNGSYYVTYRQNAGFRSYDGAAAYQTLNAGKITLSYNDGANEAVLGSSDVLTVASADHATKTVVLKIDASAVTLGTCELTFDPGLRGNNETSVLGSDITFTF